ncbi:MAG: DUF1501 domain-containing protein [Pirellulales bacterium]
MLQLGSAATTLFGRPSRREMLRVGSLGLLGGWSWADLLRSRAAAMPARRKANAVIVLWLWGGPSHIDLFDLKPAAPIEYRGPYEPISTSVPSLQISELLPRTAQRIDRCCLIRSMVSASQDHGVAGTIGLTGSMSGAIDLGGKPQGGSVQPATGSIVGRIRGFAPDRLPPYLIVGSELHQGKKRVVGEGAGTLGGLYDPFRVTYSPVHGVQLPETSLPDGLSLDTVRTRRELLSGMDRRLFDSLGLSPATERSAMQTMDRHYELAMSLILSGAAREVLRLEKEPAAARQAYGGTRFGQSCLLARRLVEGGIPFVQVNWSTHVEPHEDGGDGGWDMHDRNFQQLQDRHAWIFDRAYAALLDDLEERGLLQSTLVLAVGEFGRTPKINGKAGRDHWPSVYSALLAGGGTRGGSVVGGSDKLGEHPSSRPVTPADLGTSILSTLGIGVTDLTTLGLVPQGSVVDEAFG